jgi:hypothetical protein
MAQQNSVTARPTPDNKPWLWWCARDLKQLLFVIYLNVYVHSATPAGEPISSPLDVNHLHGYTEMANYSLSSLIFNDHLGLSEHPIDIIYLLFLS